MNLMTLIRTLDDLYHHKNNWPESLLHDIARAYQSVENAASMLMARQTYDPQLLREYIRGFDLARDRRISRLICDTKSDKPLIWSMIEEVHEAVKLQRLEQDRQRLKQSNNDGKYVGLALDEHRLRKLDAEAQAVRDYAKGFLDAKHSGDDTGEGVAVALKWVLETLGTFEESDFKGRHSIVFSTLGSELSPWIRERKRSGDEWAKAIDLAKLPNKIFADLIDTYPAPNLMAADEESHRDYALRMTQFWLSAVESLDGSEQGPPSRQTDKGNRTEPETVRADATAEPLAAERKKHLLGLVAELKVWYEQYLANKTMVWTMMGGGITPTKQLRDEFAAACEAMGIAPQPIQWTTEEASEAAKSMWVNGKAGFRQSVWAINPRAKGEPRHLYDHGEYRDEKWFPVAMPIDRDKFEADICKSVLACLAQWEVHIRGLPDEQSMEEIREKQVRHTILAATGSKTLEQIESETPALNKESIEWIAAKKENEKNLKLPIKTLREYRSPSKGGRTLPCKMYGIDRDGRKWRRQGTPNSRVYYLASSLPGTVE